MYWRKDRSTTSLVACEADCIFSIWNFWVFIIISSVFQKKRYVSPTDATKSAFTFLFLSSVSWNFGFCLGFEILQVSFWTKFPSVFRVGKWWRKHTSLSLSSCIKLFKEIWDLTAHILLTVTASSLHRKVLYFICKFTGQCNYVTCLVMILKTNCDLREVHECSLCSFGA